jgi:hypothetical protein
MGYPCVYGAMPASSQLAAGAANLGMVACPKGCLADRVRIRSVNIWYKFESHPGCQMASSGMLVQLFTLNCQG